MEDGLMIDKDRNDYITVKHKAGQRFKLMNPPGSIFSILGYTRGSYVNLASYRGEREHQVKEKIYMFIKNLVDKGPILEIGPDDDPHDLCPINIKFRSPIANLTNFVVQFKPINDNNKKVFYDFQGKKHRISMKFICE
jgi:hypothetical protein